MEEFGKRSFFQLHVGEVGIFHIAENYEAHQTGHNSKQAKKNVTAQVRGAQTGTNAFTAARRPLLLRPVLLRLDWEEEVFGNLMRRGKD